MIMQEKSRSDKIALSLNEVLKEIRHRNVLKGQYDCVLFVAGNSYRSDDGVGPYIAGMLAPFLHGIPKIHLINANTTPENYVDEVIRISPEFLVILDAANFKKDPGEFIFLDDEKDLPKNSISTHTLPLNLIASLIRSECSCSIIYIGIQISDICPGEGLSKEVRKAADLFIQGITQLMAGNMDA